jgi:hypothetical protein
MVRPSVAVMSIVLALIVGCGSSEPPAGTVPATPAQVEHIRKFLKPGASLTSGYVARSQAHKFAHFFAGRIGGVREADAVGVWVVTGPADFTGGTTYSVDANAKAYSVAPDGSTMKAEITMSDPPASELQRFVRSQH